MITRVHRVLAGSIVMAAWLAGCGHEQKAAAPPPAATPAPPPAAKASPLDPVVLDANAPQLKQIRVQAVETMLSASDEITSPARIETNPNRVSHIVLPVSGRVQRVYVKLGDSVQQGQTLAEVESPDAESAESAFLQADAGVTQAKAARVKAQNDFDRASDLFQNNAIAKKEVLNSESALVQAKAAVEQAEAARVQAVRRLEILGLIPGKFNQHVLIKAPLTGKVLDINVVAGEYRNDTSAQLMTIADLRSVWITSEVPESSIRLCRVGGGVIVELVAFPSERFRARVTHISDTVDPQMRTVKVRSEIDNSSGKFRPDMSGKVMYSDAHRPMPIVPEGALLQSEARTVVYVEETRGRFVPREVTLGKQYGSSFIVQSGLRAGERVVVEGAVYLRGGV